MNSDIMNKTYFFASNKSKIKSLKMPLNTKRKKSLSMKTIIEWKNKFIFSWTGPK